jgi:prepilin-type N-terminal cleavage/methylation domain-containing protein
VLIMKRLRQLKSHTNNSRGVTLVEVMVSVMIFGLIMGVIGNVFFTTQKLYGTTTQRAAQQNSARTGVSIMLSEIRRAGSDPDGTGTVIALASAAVDTIRVQSETNDIAGLQTVEPSEDVRYFYDSSTETVFRDPGTGPQEFMTNVTAFDFGYFDSNNVALGPLPLTPALAGQVRSIAITMTTETNNGGEMVVTTRVGLRNSGN